MKCKVCGVNVNSRGKKCPICGNQLEGKVKDYVFPNIKRKKNTLLKVVLTLSLIIALITGYVDFEINHGITWSLYVFLGLITNYVSFYYIINSYKDIFTLLGKYGFIIFALLFIWYMVTGSKFITNYIIPSICILELLFCDVVALIVKRNHIRKYLGVILANIILSFVPLILIFFNIIDFDYIAHFAFLFSCINTFILVIFDFNDVKDELLMIFNY